MADGFSCTLPASLIAMCQRPVYTWILLLLLIVVLSFTCYTGQLTTWQVAVIAGTSLIKFLLVSFNFMDIRNTHTIWKVLMVLFATGIYGAIFVLTW